MPKRKQTQSQKENSQAKMAKAKKRKSIQTFNLGATLAPRMIPKRVKQLSHTATAKKIRTSGKIRRAPVARATDSTRYADGTLSCSELCESARATRTHRSGAGHIIVRGNVQHARIAAALDGPLDYNCEQRALDDDHAA